MVPLSRPLFDGFGLDVSSEKGQKESSGEAGSIEVDVSSQVQKPSKAGKLTSKKMSHAVVERLPNGWSKKAVKRLTGIAKGNLLWGIDNCSGVARSVLKVAFIQKGLINLSFLQTDEPNYFPELKF